MRRSRGFRLLFCGYKGSIQGLQRTFSFSSIFRIRLPGISPIILDAMGYLGFLKQIRIRKEGERRANGETGRRETSRGHLRTVGVPTHPYEREQKNIKRPLGLKKDSNPWSRIPKFRYIIPKFFILPAHHLHTPLSQILLPSFSMSSFH